MYTVAIQLHAYSVIMLGHNLSLPTAFIDYLTVLLEYIEHNIVNSRFDTEENWLDLCFNSIQPWLLYQTWTSQCVLYSIYYM